MKIRVPETKQEKVILTAWIISSIIALALVGTFSYYSHLFGYAYKVIQMPIPALVTGLCLSSTLFYFLYRLISYTTKNISDLHLITVIIVATGIIMRLTLFFSEPVLEDDYQRYLWDGTVTAHGINPYRHSPQKMKEFAETNNKIKQIATEAGVVLKRINHPELRTIYPPVTQGLFAVAHYIKPFSLNAWRTILLVFDCLTLVLIFLLLTYFKRSLIWSALYWWNPIVLKELFNSAHMEAILIPLVLAGIYFSLQKKYKLSSLILVLAAGVKIWPLALLPITLRPVFYNFRQIFPITVLSGLLCILIFLPVLYSSLDNNSGFIAYATKWKTNSALFPLLKTILESALNLTGLKNLDTNLITRSGIILILIGVLARLHGPAVQSAQDHFRRSALLIISIFLLSPAQFPWYLVWIIPFLAFYPANGFLALIVTMPMYYLAFFFMARKQLDLYNAVIIWLVWLPVWILLGFELLKTLRSRQKDNDRQVSSTS